MFLQFCISPYFGTEEFLSKSQSSHLNICKVPLEIQKLIFCFITSMYTYTCKETENPGGLIHYSVVPDIPSLLNAERSLLAAAEY